MANNVTVKWMQVSNFKLANGGTGIGDGVTYTSLLNDATKKVNKILTEDNELKEFNAE